jgi:hypothetical protein
MNDCSNCSRLQAENRQLLKRVEKLTAIVNRVSKACQDIAARAEAIMAQHQPRGIWAYAKGTRAVAQAIAALIR